MQKNISSTEDALGNVFMPFVHAGDISNIMKNRKIASQFQNSSSVMVNDTKVSNTTSNGSKNGFLSFNYKKKNLKFYYNSKNRMLETVGMIRDEFINQESGRINVKNKDVVDIGAYVADTSIYYAMNGARHVYAFEPYPYFYNIGLKNLQLNKLSKKITLTNAGCGSETSKAKLNESDTNFNRVQSKGKSTKGINIMSLNEIVKKYGIKNGSLKVDCEGCEYDIILKTDSNVLRKFSYIQIEYHYGYANLLERLKEAGFKAEYTKPLKKYNFITSSFMVIGFINARRI